MKIYYHIQQYIDNIIFSYLFRTSTFNECILKKFNPNLNGDIGVLTNCSTNKSRGFCSSQIKLQLYTKNSGVILSFNQKSKFEPEYETNAHEENPTPHNARHNL